MTTDASLDDLYLWGQRLLEVIQGLWEFSQEDIDVYRKIEGNTRIDRERDL